MIDRPTSTDRRDTPTALRSIAGSAGEPVDIARRLRDGAPTLSFEFFPPKDDAGVEVLWQALRRLEPLDPTFVSVTYGAGGTTRDRTVRVTERIAAETTMLPMAHLTCVGSTRAELRSVIGEYAAAGVRTVMALRGDPQAGPGTPWVSHPGGLDHADELVELVRSLGDFAIGVAAFPDIHPESRDLAQDARVLARKQAAGASFAVSQMVFDVEAYLRLRDAVDALGCELPIVPGLMPVTSYSQVSRMAVLTGAALPGEVISRLEAVAENPAAVRAVGVDIATEHSERLLAEGAPGLHFYTMNRSTATLEVASRLGHPRAMARTA